MWVLKASRCQSLRIKGIIGYILGLSGDNGKEHGNYFNILRDILGCYGLGFRVSDEKAQGLCRFSE